MRRRYSGPLLHLVAECAMAFGAAVLFFLASAIAYPLRHELVVVLALGAVCLYIVVAAARRLGPLYAVPLGIAAGLAFDSFYIPPTRQFGDGHWQNWLVIGIYLAMGVLVGMLAAVAQRRAEASERARGRLADEQAALRRVATLVTRQPSPSEVFAAVAREVGHLLGVDEANLLRFEGDGTATVVGAWSAHGRPMPLGIVVSLVGDSVAARIDGTGRPARIDDLSEASGPLAADCVGAGIRSAVGAPVVVERRTWGALVAASCRLGAPRAGAEARVEEFTELVATAISNVHARTELAASRARIVAATEAERGRVVRDLHDGAQQRLVHTVVTLKLARRALARDPDEAPPLVDEALAHAENAMVELRELAHGILPAVLARGGLPAGVGALASRMPIPVDVCVPDERLPSTVESTGYFLVAEALTNVVKHARAERASVRARLDEGTLRVEVRDDGAGGARSDGNGLVGLADRLAVVGGRLRIESPPGGGTLIAAVIPLGDGVG